MAQDGTTGNEKQKKGGLIIVFLGIIILLLAVIIVLILRKGTDQAQEPVAESTPQPTMRATVVTRENAEEVADRLASEPFVEPGYYTATMTNEWHFASGSAVSEDAYVENLLENTNDVYFDVVLAENEDAIILASPVIPRGTAWDEISLDTDLDAGTYDCVMIYHLIDEEQNTVSTLRVGLTIVVES